MTDSKTKVYQDVLTNTIPQRVPVDVPLSFEAILQNADINVKDAQWKPSMIGPAVREICERVHSDKSPFTRPSRTAGMYKFLDSKSFVFSNEDVMQHPEIASLYVEDYDALIANPYDCMVETALPRFNGNVDYKNDPEIAMLNFLKAYSAQQVDSAEYGSVTASIIAEYDYFKGYPAGATVAPLDFLGDILRSFSGVSTDIRRNKQKVIDATEALFPLLFKLGTPGVINEYSRAMYWTHMPTFMRTKDFEEVWWPTFYKMAVNYASMGVGIFPWLEDDWERYTDHLYDLPTNSMLRFEYGNMQNYKDKLGKKHILCGAYPLSDIKSKSKEGCIDTAKELLDVMAPGGRFIFMMDKVVMTISREEFDKLCAVIDYVIEYGKYDNAGEKSGLDFCKDDYTFTPTKEFTSKYYKDWSKVEGINPECAKKMQKVEDGILNYVVALFK